MKRIATLYFLICTVFTLQAEVIETQHMSELHRHLKPGMLVIFDIDNTLIEPVQELGNDQWYRAQLKKHQSNNLPVKVAQNKALRDRQDRRHAARRGVPRDGVDDAWHGYVYVRYRSASVGKY